MRVSRGTLSFALLIGLSAMASPARSGPPSGVSKSTVAADNSEMTAIFDADQSDRQGLAKIDWPVVNARDDERRARTKTLLDLGKLRTAGDFYDAAFGFQHGHKAEDFLLAHTFALVAAARGRADATWIAAATLDRYLMNVGQKQIYGTQFVTPSNGPTQPGTI